MFPANPLHYENQQVLSLLQALWGAISPNMLGVSLQCVGADVHLHFILDHDSPEDREEIEDIVAELEALQETAVSIEAHVSVRSGQWRGVASLVGRPVFAQRHDKGVIEADG